MVILKLLILLALSFNPPLDGPPCNGRGRCPEDPPRDRPVRKAPAVTYGPEPLCTGRKGEQECK